MSVPNINQNFSQLDARYAKPADVANAIQTQAASDSTTYQPLLGKLATISGAPVPTVPIMGKFNSYSAAARIDNVTATVGSSTITDPSITAGDAGKPVNGGGIPLGSFVGSISVGTSFILVNSTGTAVLVTDLAPTQVGIGGSPAPLLPPLTTGAVATALAAGQIVRVKISKSKSDTSANPVYVTAAAGDTFESGGSTMTLSVAGEKVTLIAGTVSGGTSPVWIVDEHTSPRDVLDSRYATISPAFRALRAALDSGRTAAIQLTGDSTIDSTAGYRPGEYAALDLATAYPNLHVVIMQSNQTTGVYGPQNVLRAGPSGRRYVEFGGRSMRWLETTPTQFAQDANSRSIMDLAALIQPDLWPGAAAQVLITRGRKVVAGTLSNELQVQFQLNSDNTLHVQWSRNGTSYDSNTASTVAITPPSPNSPLWVRCVLTLQTGANGSAAFYTSIDGATWAQLGTTVSITYPTTALWQPAAGAFWEIGGGGWQPAGSTFKGRIYEIRIRDGISGKLIAPCLPDLWERYPDNSNSTGGSPTLIVINSAKAGTTIAYHVTAAQSANELADYGQQVVLFSDSHNEVGASGPIDWIAPYAAWVAQWTAFLPNANICVVKQNPHSSAWTNELLYGESHKQRLDELVRYALTHGWDVVDFYAPLLNAPEGLGYWLRSDGLHPSDPAGYQKLGHVLSRAMGVIATGT